MADVIRNSKTQIFTFLHEAPLLGQIIIRFSENLLAADF